MSVMLYIPRAWEYIEAARKLYEKGEISKDSYKKVKERCEKIEKTDPLGHSKQAS